MESTKLLLSPSFTKQNQLSEEDRTETDTVHVVLRIYSVGCKIEKQGNIS